jgi:hypothetical protein
MVLMAIGGALLGAVFGLRFKVLVLLPGGKRNQRNRNLDHCDQHHGLDRCPSIRLSRRAFQPLRRGRRTNAPYAAFDLARLRTAMIPLSHGLRERKKPPSRLMLLK